MGSSSSQQDFSQTNAIVVYKKGEFFQRFFAFLIDSLLIGLSLFFVYRIFPHVPILNNNFIIFVCVALYGTIFIWAKGATPGKMALRLRVVSSSYQPVSFGSALLR